MNGNAPECCHKDSRLIGTQSAPSILGCSAVAKGSLGYVTEILEGLHTVIALSDPDKQLIDPYQLSTLQALARDSIERAQEELATVVRYLDEQADKELQAKGVH